MDKLKSLFFLAMATIMAFEPANAKKLTYTVSEYDTNGSRGRFHNTKNLYIPEFDPTIGSLKSARFFLDGNYKLKFDWDFNLYPNITSGHWFSVFVFAYQVIPRDGAGEMYYVDGKQDGFDYSGFTFTSQVDSVGSVSFDLPFHNNILITSSDQLAEFQGLSNSGVFTYLDYAIEANQYDPAAHVNIGGSLAYSFGVEYIYSVPETEIWALFIIGFGACGSMLRRERKKLC